MLTGNQLSEVHTRLEVARLAYEKGLFVSAARNYRSALNNISESQANGSEEQAAALLGMAQCQSMLGNFSEAERLCKQCIELDLKLFGANSYDLAIALTNLSEIYIKEKRYDESLFLLVNCKQIFSDEPQWREELAIAQKDLSWVYCKLGRLSEASDQLRKTLNLCQSNGLKHSNAYAETLGIYAYILVSDRKYAEAQEALDEAISILELNTGGIHPELVKFLEYAAELSKLRLAPEKLKLLLERSKTIRENIRVIDR